VLSGLMAGPDAKAIPASWRDLARLTQAADLPSAAVQRTELARGWLARLQVPLVSERVQIDTYVACAALSEMVGSLLGTYSRELLVERFEDMLARAANPARYPHLSLSQRQRFASRGGYVLRFAGPDSDARVADSEWTTP
jgi:hypothetical protein